MGQNVESHPERPGPCSPSHEEAAAMRALSWATVKAGLNILMAETVKLRSTFLVEVVQVLPTNGDM